MLHFVKANPFSTPENILKSDDTFFANPNTVQKVFGLIRKNVKAKKKINIKFMVIFNGDLTYFYPTPDKVRIMIQLANM